MGITRIIRGLLGVPGPLASIGLTFRAVRCNSAELSPGKELNLIRLQRAAFVFNLITLPILLLASRIGGYIPLKVSTILFLELGFFLVSLGLIRYLVYARHAKQRAQGPVIGFYHPHCDQRAGGEKVLWTAVEGLLKDTNSNMIVYSNRLPKRFGNAIAAGNDASHWADKHAQTILSQAATTFNLPNLTSATAKSRIHFVFLNHCDMSDPHHYPRITMVLQCLGALLPAFEAVARSVATELVDLCSIRLKKRPGFCPSFLRSFATANATSSYSGLVPTHMIDTAGYPFALLVFRVLAGLKVGVYVHYPTITHNMIDRVQANKVDYNHSQEVASSKWRTSLKLMYYRAFARLYRLCGACADMVMVNSSWTRAELAKMWSHPAQHMHCVFPPCRVIPPSSSPSSTSSSYPSSSSTSTASSSSSSDKFKTKNTAERIPIFVSLGQFRPEKNHTLQLEALQVALRQFGKSEIAGQPIQLFMIGTLREEDSPRVEELRSKIKALDLEKHVRIMTNVPFDVLQSTLATALGGLHSMRDEHFGIGVVELLASGLITVAHSSAGPLMDIVVPANSDPKAVGYLAEETAKDYAVAMVEILQKYERTIRTSRPVAADSAAAAAAAVAQVPSSASTESIHMESGDGDDADADGYVTISSPNQKKTATSASSASDSLSASASATSSTSSTSSSVIDELAPMRARAQERMQMFSEDAFRASIRKVLVPWILKA